MFTIWTHPSELVPYHGQTGVIGSGLNASEYPTPGQLRYVRADGTVILF